MGFASIFQIALCLVSILAQEPSAELKARKILESLKNLSKPVGEQAELAESQLVDLGKEALVPLHESLRGSSLAQSVVAARVLGKIGDPSSLAALDAALKSSPPGDAIRPFLESLFAVDSVKAVDLALPLLDHKSAPVRSAAQALLSGKLRPEHLPVILALSRAKREDARIRALQLLSSFSAEEAMDRSLEALTDTVPEAAAAAARVAARHPSPKALEKLLAVVQSGYSDRGWAYACLSLAQRIDLSPANAANLKPIPVLRTALSSKDPFVCGSAAVLLSEIGYTAPESEDTTYLDREVPDALIGAVGRNAFYRDISSLLPLALRQMQLLSGQSGLRNSSDWAGWWLAHREGFKANRASFKLLPGEEEKLVFEWARARIAGRIVFRGAKAAATSAEEEFLLAREDLAAIFRRLREGGFLAGPAAAEVEDQDRLQVRLDPQSRIIPLTDSGEASQALRAMLLAMRERNLWQLYPDLSRFSSREAYVQSETGWWQQETDEDLRRLRLKGVLLRAMPTLAAFRKISALELLLSMPGVAGRISREDSLALFEMLRQESSPTPLAQKILALLLKQPDEMILGKIIDGLLEKFGKDSRALLVEALASSSAASLQSFLSDQRSLIRSAAACALIRKENFSAEESLLPLLQDEDLEVRRSAVFALGEVRAKKSLPRLMEASVSAPPELRADLCLAVGRIGGPEALTFLVRMAGDSQVEVQEAAVKGLTEIGDDHAAGILAELALQPREGRLPEIAQEGLLGLDPARARPSLLSRLKSEDPKLRRRAALLLVEMFEADGIPTLLESLKAESSDSRVLEVLAKISAQDFTEAADAASRYEAWWETHREGNPRTWFEQALGAAPPSTQDFIPLLKDSRWVIRLHAAHWLRSATGKGLSALNRHSSKEEWAKASEIYQKLIAVPPESGRK